MRIENKISDIQVDSEDKITWLLSGNKSQALCMTQIYLNQMVNGSALKEALDKTVKRYEVLRVRFGVEGNNIVYYETNSDVKILNQPVDCKINLNQTEQRYPWQICYYEKYITFYFNHALLDGKGMIEIVKTLLYYYATELGINNISTKKIKTLDNVTKEIIEKENVLPFKTYSKIPCDEPLVTKPSLPISEFDETKLLGEEEKYRMTRLYINEEQFIKETKQLQTTPFAFTSIMIAKSIKSIFKVEKPNIPITISMDLRDIYGSDTMHNFITQQNIDYNSETMDTMPTDICCTAFRSILDVRVQKENCTKELEGVVKFDEYLSTLPIEQQKNIVNAHVTQPEDAENVALSYMRIKLPKEIEDIVDDIFVQGINFHKYSVEMISYKGNMIMNIKHKLKGNETFEELKELFKKHGIDSSYKEIPNNINIKCEI